MIELKIRSYKGEMYLADVFGNIIMKKLRNDQILSVQSYEKKRIKRLSKT